MKIGIMSMQRVKNLGSFMQAYGLKTTIESLGHTVSFIDYKQGEETTNVVNISNKKNIKKIFDKLNKCKYIFSVIKFKKIFNNYYNKQYRQYLKEYLNIDDNEYRENCDTLVVGSDEVFNCLNNQYGFSDDAFGGYKKAKKIISYAASCGWTKYEFLTDAQKSVLSKSVPNFSTISVRDENTKDFISNFYKGNISTNLDPVLISDFSKFNKKTSKIIHGNYIIVYAYYNRFSNKKEIKKIKELAKKTNSRLIAVGSPQYWCDDFVTLPPNEIFDFFEKSKYVITDTFHGTIFSVRAHCKFLTIIRNSNNNKLSDLLKRLELEDRKYKVGDMLSIIKKDIDYKKIEKILEQERKRTIEYLKNNLK